jgi:hypothetical protein
VESEQLLTQSEILEDEILATTEGTHNPAEHVPEPQNHDRILAKSPNRPDPQVIEIAAVRCFDDPQCLVPRLYNEGRPHSSLGPGVPEKSWCSPLTGPRNHRHRLPRVCEIEPRTSWAVYITNTVWNSASLDPSRVSAEDTPPEHLDSTTCHEMGASDTALGLPGTEPRGAPARSTFANQAVDGLRWPFRLRNLDQPA